MFKKFITIIILTVFLSLGVFQEATALTVKSAENNISISLTVSAFVKTSIEGDEFVVMTNSYDPVMILEDGKALDEKAVYGKFSRIKMKPGSHYAVSSGF